MLLERSRGVRDHCVQQLAGMVFLCESELTFSSRSESEDFVFSENAVPCDHYATTFVRKTSSSAMHVGHHGIVESHAKQCASNAFNDITGSNILPCKEVV